MTFELLVANVCDANMDWEDPFQWTAEEIIKLLIAGRLKKEDYEIQYHVIHQGVFNPPKYCGEILSF